MAAPLYAEEQTALKTRADKESYGTGVEFVRTLQQRAGAVNLDLVIQGMKDALTGEKLLLSESEISMAGADDQTERGRREPPVPAMHDAASSAAPPPAEMVGQPAPAADHRVPSRPDTSEPRVAMGGAGGSRPAPGGELVPGRQSPKMGQGDWKTGRARIIADRISGRGVINNTLPPR
jgi:hypothetical protein